MVTMMKTVINDENKGQMAAAVVAVLLCHPLFSRSSGSTNKGSSNSQWLPRSTCESTFTRSNSSFYKMLQLTSALAMLTLLLSAGAVYAQGFLGTLEGEMVEV